MDSHNTLIADDLLENIYQSLSELGDIKLIITQMYNFFKEKKECSTLFHRVDKVRPTLSRT